MHDDGMSNQNAIRLQMRLSSSPLPHLELQTPHSVPIVTNLYLIPAMSGNPLAIDIVVACFTPYDAPYAPAGADMALLVIDYM